MTSIFDFIHTGMQDQASDHGHLSGNVAQSFQFWVISFFAVFSPAIYRTTDDVLRSTNTIKCCHMKFVHIHDRNYKTSDTHIACHARICAGSQLPSFT